MVINLECPWCDKTVTVTRDELDGDIGCDNCGVTFIVAADESTELAVAA